MSNRWNGKQIQNIEKKIKTKDPIKKPKLK